jgi:hypothetical protein
MVGRIEDSFTVLHGMAAHGSTERFKHLLRLGWSRAAFETDGWGGTALHYAAQGGHTELVVPSFSLPNLLTGLSSWSRVRVATLADKF